MFGIGSSELVLIAVVALVVIGPKDLPRVMRTVGQWSSKMKHIARDFQSQFNEALREAELEDVKKEVESLAKIDPLAGVRKDITAIDASLREGVAKSTTVPSDVPMNADANGREVVVDDKAAEKQPE